jgi:hypothetical protein
LGIPDGPLPSVVGFPELCLYVIEVRPVGCHFPSIYPSSSSLSTFSLMNGQMSFLYSSV